MALALFALVACTDQGIVSPNVAGGNPIDQPPVGAPVDPTAPDAPLPLPLADQVIEFTEDGAEAPHSLTVSRIVNLAVGQTKSAQITIAAGVPAKFDLILGQKDSTAAVLEATPIWYRRQATDRSITLADETGLLADNDVVVPNTFNFESAGSYTFDVPLRGVAEGRGVIQVIWTMGDGQKLGLLTFEYRVS
jgi:hypothetical protein